MKNKIIEAIEQEIAELNDTLQKMKIAALNVLNNESWSAGFVQGQFQAIANLEKQVALWVKLLPPPNKIDSVTNELVIERITKELEEQNKELRDRIEISTSLMSNTLYLIRREAIGIFCNKLDSFMKEIVA
jgi:Mg2+ and Co2+ transporter CorA